MGDDDSGTNGADVVGVLQRDGPAPEEIRQSRITVNALVIGLPAEPQGIDPGLGELVGYFKTKVIEGPDAFTETALGFDDFSNAMTRKLLRELQIMVVGQGPQPLPWGKQSP